MRQLKHHEKKLLRKVDLYSWKGENTIRAAKIMRRYLIQNRDDFTSYTKLVGMVKSLSAKLKTLPSDDNFRIEMTGQLLDKLFNMGILQNTKSLQKAEEITVSAICRRRLPVVMVRMKMAEHLKAAVTFIEQGQVRVGTNVVTDPAFLVTRNLEDFVTWVDTSKIRRTIHKYNDKLDDFDLL
eukprot:CAMPEP_0178973762 /NCGR_PEP_ID=MMETSP0789-20121207/21945_1 /TAXON_ID=3005 /ORGANISM="Rhizosolenia setigera, Strain CCMP 1694" /LENGTH=181 /DNA_ID=CAMNT_0020661749 /DNA_START=9 /DNA_END=554 /DNA_ORIENTATION=-